MAISYSPTTRSAAGKDYEPIITQLLFENKTVGEELVAFETDVKADTVFTESTVVATMQAYTSGAPSSSGTLGASDRRVTPVKIMYYQEFDPNTLRSSRFGKSMKKGAWEVASSEFEGVVLELYNSAISYDAELKWYNNALSATQTTVAGLTPGALQTQVSAAEQAYVAALTAGQFDGLVTYLIYNNAAVGGRIKVASPTTINATNIKDEYDKLYQAIPALVLNQRAVRPRIYAPYSHLQFINTYNNNPTNFKQDIFVVADLGKPTQKVFFNGLEIVFVPLGENIMIAARPDYLIWCTDLLSDINKMKLDHIANNREDMFVKHIFTIFAHVVNQANNVLYVG